MKTIPFLIFSVMLTWTLGTSAQPDYYMYVSDAGGFNNPPWQILRYDLDGSNPQVFIDNNFFLSEGVGWPQDILFLEDQNAVLISNLVGNRITKHDASTGAYLEDFATVDGGPTRMKIGSDNLIYVVQWSNSNNKVLRYQQDGTFLGEFTDVGVPSSVGFDWDGDGNLYVGSYGANNVTKFDTNGLSQGLYISSDLSGPTNIQFESDGNLLVLNWNGGNIKRFDTNGDLLEVFTVDVTQPEGIAINPVTGNYIIGNGGPAQIDEFQPDGTFVSSLVTSGAGGLVQPNAVVIREASLSVKETSRTKVMVTPTMGSLFQLNAPEIESILALNVYNMMGQQVTTISMEETYWDARTLSEGLYIIKGKTADSYFYQKIIVKK